MSNPCDEVRFRALIEQSLDAIALVEPDGGVSYVSPAIVRVLGYTPEEFIALKAFEVVHPDERDQAIKLLASVVQQPGGSQTVLNRARHKDGSWRWIETISTNQIENPSLRAIVANFRDVTERKQAEEILRDADRRTDELVSILAHELRNPLAAINNAVQLSLRSAQDADRAWSRDVIERQARHLARLIDDLLDVSRLTRGKIELHKEQIDLAPVISRAVRSVRPLIEKKQHNLTVSVTEDQMAVYADPARMEQVLVNLITNAAKYTKDGGQIALTADRDGEVIVTVKDTGVGIPPAMLTRIFDPFAQVDRTINNSPGGLGIGLTLVKKIVELHGGTATAASAGIGKGSEFTIRFPVAAGPIDGSPSG
jgi:PAS domain S-box-containing protein